MENYGKREILSKTNYWKNQLSYFSLIQNFRWLIFYQIFILQFSIHGIIFKIFWIFLNYLQAREIYLLFYKCGYYKHLMLKLLRHLSKLLTLQIFYCQDN